MDDAEFITVPIVADFGERKPIGEMRILSSALPPEPDYCFALGFKALDMNGGQVTSYRLLEVGIVSDALYANYIAHHLHADKTASSSAE